MLRPPLRNTMVLQTLFLLIIAYTSHVHSAPRESTMNIRKNESNGSLSGADDVNVDASRGPTSSRHLELKQTHVCRDFDEISYRSLNHPNTDAVCKINSCPGGCCRILTFFNLVCDQTNTFEDLQCICNEYTDATPDPTTSPSPTKSPTAVPTVTVTDPPTDFPTPNPTTSQPTISTDQPTLKPTETTTGSPTDHPTKNPSPAPTLVPSANPTATPTMLPSASPTARPYNTEKATDLSGNSVLVSTCKAAPPKMKNIEEMNFQYDYEVYVKVNVQDEQTLVEDYLNDRIHGAITREFMKCTYQNDDVWSIESSAHTVDSNKSCRINPPSSQKCFVVTASENVWVYDDSRRYLQGGGKDSSSDFSVLINTFLFEAMGEGLFNDPDNGINQIFYVNDGSNKIITGAPTKSPAPTTSPAPSTSSPSKSPTLRPTDNEYDSNTVIDSNDGSVGQVNRGEFENATREDKSNAATAVIVTLSIACAAIVLILLLSIIGRRRRNVLRAQHGGYVVKRTNTDPINQVTSLEEHVDLGSVPSFGDSGGGVVLKPYYPDGDDDDDTHDNGKLRPLHTQDELNCMYQVGPEISKNRSYSTKDTVEL